MSVLAPFYREYELPWEGDPEASSRFRKILRTLLIIFVLFGIIVPFLPNPKPTAEETAVPERIAIVMQEKPKPPPPPPKPVEQEKPKPKPEEKTPVKPPPTPVDQKQVAHEKAQKQVNQFKDELADLRQQMDLTPMQQTKNLSGAVGADSHAERNLITSKAGQGSSGITSANSSRGFGSGAGSLTGHDTTAVTSSIASGGLNAHGVSHAGNGKAGRSQEEIATVFDRQKGAIYSLYIRATRSNPELQGKVVLEFTISPGGDVTACRVVSSELKDEDLERKIVSLVKLFKFEAKDVAVTTTTKPMDFFPAG